MTRSFGGRRGLAVYGALAVVVALSLATLGAGHQVQAGSSALAGSGGRAVAHRAGGHRVSAPNTPKARLSRVGYNAAEPTLGFTRNGDLFYTAGDVYENLNTVEVLRSENAGKRWKNVSPSLAGVKTHRITLDPYIFVDDVGGDKNRIFNIDLTLACSYLSYSDNNGKSWTTNPLACGRPVNDHQTLFAGPPVSSPTIGYENIVYYCWNDVATSSCSKSLDGGITWSPTGQPAFPGVNEEGDLCGGLHGHGVVDKKGTIYLPRDYCGKTYIAISKNEGRSWRRVKVSNIELNGDIDPSVDVDNKGNIYVTFTDEKRRLPYLVTSKNGGKTWSKAKMIGVPGLKEANLATLDASGAGKVSIAYMGSTNSKWPSCIGVKGDCDADYTKTTWNGYITMSTNALAKRPLFYSGDVNNPKDPLLRGKCGPGRCSVVFDFIDTVISPNGTPWAAFVDGCMLTCINGYANYGSEGLAAALVGGPRL